VNRCDPCCSHAWGSCSCVSAAEYFTGFAVADATVQAEALVSDLRTQDIRIGTQDLRITAMAVGHDARDLERTSRCPGAWPGDRGLVGSGGRSQVNANVSPWEYAGTKRACAPSIRPTPVSFIHLVHPRKAGAPTRSRSAAGLSGEAEDTPF
jgi:hypothetical protein